MSETDPLTHISDTARWVAVYRAMESERPDALFHDPYARTLAGAQGEAIVNSMPKGRQWAWPMIVRTAVMDEIIVRTVHRDGADVVLNLAAGLDARPFRLDLPPTLRWVDADLPGILDHKRGVLDAARPHCRLEYAPTDLTDADARAALLERVGQEGRRVLIVAEGLLIYLEESVVASLARGLHAQPTFRWWLIDLASPRLLKLMGRTWGKRAARGNAPFRFAPAENTAFFEPHGWREIEYRPAFDEAFRLGRTMQFAWFWRFIGRLYPKKMREAFARFSGMVLLERV